MFQNGIEQTTTTTGTGPYDLTPPTDPLRISFVDGVGSGERVGYRAELVGSADWEEGWGVATAGSPDTLTRNVMRSSNSDAAVNWPAGTKRIYCSPLSDLLRFGSVGDVPLTTGSATAFAIAHTPPVMALLPGMSFRFQPSVRNTGAATLNIDGLGAIAIRRGYLGGTALSAGDLPPGVPCEVLYDGTYFRLVSPVVPETQSLARAVGAALTLTGSADTTWVYFAQLYNGSGEYTANQLAGVGYGGQSLDAGVTGQFWSGIAFRVS